MINIVSKGMGSSRIFGCFNEETNDFLGIIGDIETSKYNLIENNVENAVTECLMKYGVHPAKITHMLETLRDRVRSAKGLPGTFAYLRFQTTIRSSTIIDMTFQGYYNYYRDNCLDRYTNPQRSFFHPGIARIRPVSLVKSIYQIIVDNLK